MLGLSACIPTTVGEGVQVCVSVRGVPHGIVSIPRHSNVHFADTLKPKTLKPAHLNAPARVVFGPRCAAPPRDQCTHDAGMGRGGLGYVQPLNVLPFYS